MPRRAVFVDRDGTINALVPDPKTGAPESPLTVSAVALLPGAAAALRALAQDGWLLIGVTNQPAAAKGTITLEQLWAVQQRVVDLLAQDGAHLDDFRVCLHHPDGIISELSGDCDCRKPKPGMLLDAAESHDIDLPASWIVGDTDSDIVAGRAAGCHTAMVEQWGSEHKRTGSVVPDMRIASLTELPEILRHERSRLAPGPAAPAHGTPPPVNS